MPNPVSVSKFEVKSHNSPDEKRTPPKTEVDVVHLGDATLGRFTFQPGWRWSECIKPVVNTETCQNSHMGYAVSGHLNVQLADGTKKSIGPGDSFTIPPGHDGWVEGNEPFVCIEVLSAEQFAQPR